MELTKDNYFEDTHYFSTSRWKRFHKCEELGLVPFSSPSEDMLIGSYIDSWVSGDLEQFTSDHPEIIAKTGKNKGQLKVGFQKAEEIIEYMKLNPTIMDFFQHEKQKVMVGEIEGVPVKIMMDNYSEGIAINDLKVMRTVTNSNGQYIDFISMWSYQFQGAIYQEIVYQNTGEKLPFYIVAVTKETPINSVIVEIPQEILDTALETVKETIQRYYLVYTGRELANGCGICSTCISKRLDTPIITMWELMGQSE